MKKERRGKEDSNLTKSDLLRGLFKAIYVTINTFVFDFDGCIDHFILILDILIQDANYNLENIAVVLDMILVVY